MSIAVPSLVDALWQRHEAREQARRAQQQAHRAGLVRDFLMDVLQTAESDLPRGERATPDNLAKAAASKLRTDTTLPDEMRLAYSWMLAKASMSANAYAQAEQLLTDADVPNAPVLAYADIAGHEQFWANGYIQEIEHQNLGKMRVHGPPVSMSETPARWARPSSRLGTHAAEWPR